MKVSGGLFSSLRSPVVYLFILFTAIAFLIPIFVRTPYILFILYLCYIYVVQAENWNLIGGFAGQISLGHAAFFGIGCYTTAMMWIAGYPPILGIVLGGLLAAGFAVFLFPTFRLRGTYFAIGTLFLAAALQGFLLNWKFVGAGEGLYLPVPKEFLIEPFYYMALVLALASTVTCYMIAKSGVGLTFKAISEDDFAAASIGVGITRYKVLALVISAFFFGLSGGVYGHYQAFIDAYSIFGIYWGVTGLFMAIIGGTGTVVGPILGTFLLTIISEYLAKLGEIRLLVYSVAVIIVIRFAPEGIWGIITKKVRPRLKTYIEKSKPLK